MSMVDERPSNYIKDGKIYLLSKGKSYYSCGFTDHDPDRIIEMCYATDDNIASYIEEGKLIYSYDTGEYITSVPWVAVDQFDNRIYIGSRVLFMDCNYDGSFYKYAVGTVVGETREYIKIKPDDEKLLERSKYVYKDGKYQYVDYKANYILRSKIKKRVLLIRKLK